MFVYLISSVDIIACSKCRLSGDHDEMVSDRKWPFGDLRLKGMSPGLRTPMYPYVALRCPTYRENSHANHTWHRPPHKTAYFHGSELSSPWVRFPSPAPLLVAWRVPALSCVRHDCMQFLY